MVSGISSLSLTASLLSPTFQLETGSALTSGLLHDNTSLDASFNILNSSFGGSTPTNPDKGIQELEGFILTNVENNQSLLSDLTAINALSSVITSESTNNSPAIFGPLMKPFESALLLGEEELNTPFNIINTLI